MKKKNLPLYSKVVVNLENENFLGTLIAKKKKVAVLHFPSESQPVKVAYADIRGIAINLNPDLIDASDVVKPTDIPRILGVKIEEKVPERGCITDFGQADSLHYFSVGDKVEFKHCGEIVKAKIAKVNYKRLSVTPLKGWVRGKNGQKKHGSWSIPPQLLRHRK